jgi:hypothetical protein
MAASSAPSLGPWRGATWFVLHLVLVPVKHRRGTFVAPAQMGISQPEHFISRQLIERQAHQPVIPNHVKQGCGGHGRASMAIDINGYRQPY